MNNVIKRVWKQGKMVTIESLNGMTFQDESNGHTFAISAVDENGNAVSLAGTPTGNLLRADNQDVALTCSVANGVVYATLPANAYSVPGRFAITVFLTSDGQTTAIFAAIGIVSRTDSGEIAPPAGSNVTSLVNAINTAVGNIPVNFNAAFAPAYSDSGLYSVGQYVTCNGTLYRCITPVTISGTWSTNSSKFTAATLGNDVYDLKSALDEVSIEPELRNGTPQNAWNASAVCTKYVVNYTGFNSVKIVVKKPLKAEGNWYRIAVTTYTQSGIETNGSNDKQVTISQAFDNVNEVRLYKGMLDSTSVGFAVAIAEKDSDGNNVTLRITDFTPGDFVVVLDNAMLDLVTGKVNVLRDGAINGIETTRELIGEKIQFLPQKTAWSTGYWNNDKTIHSGSSYRCYAVYGFAAGTYYLNNFEEWQSYIENIETGAIQAVHYVKESADTGYKFTVDYPFNIFISSSQINSESMFANSALPSEYVYGVYPPKSEQYIIHVEKDGSGDFDKLVDAINFATQYMDSIVYVGSGTWDIIDELGSTYVESVSDTKRGLVLKNRIHVIFASNSKVTCNYTGSRSTTKQWLAAFNSGEYGFTLENARIYSDNVRYTIHDERDQDTDAYRNEYKNCKMVHSNGYYGQCIGGGLGTDGEVIIEDCYFNNTTTEGWREVVSYHNTAGSGRSFVDVHGCYFEGNHGVRFSWYGESPETDKSTMLVHGNSFGRENGTINNSAEGGATIENTEIIAYNNEFRN